MNARLLPSKYRTTRGCLAFEDAEAEKAYRVDNDLEQGARILFVTKFIVFLPIIRFVVDLVFVFKWPFAMSDMANAMVHLLFPLLLVLLFRNVIKRFPSIASTLLTCAGMLYGVWVLSANVFRDKRLGLRDDIPPVPLNAVWENCEVDLATHTRDALNIVAVLTLTHVMNLVMRTRSTIAWIIPASTTSYFVFMVFFVDDRLEDGGGSNLLAFALTVSSVLVWFTRYLDELDHRALWVLTRERAEENRWRQELLELVFTVVASVQDGSIMDTTGAFQRQFGMEVSDLSDLPSRNPDGTYEPRLVELVKEVEATRRPAKRNLLIQPRGSDLVYECTACVCTEIGNNATILGIGIKESFAVDQGDAEFA